ncbi:MAG: hypothetical protein ACLR6B_20665 [Blautia sp.]
MMKKEEKAGVCYEIKDQKICNRTWCFYYVQAFMRKQSLFRLLHRRQRKRQQRDFEELLGEEERGLLLL